jgi:hypothetical protein
VFETFACAEKFLRKCGTDCGSGDAIGMIVRCHYKRTKNQQVIWLRRNDEREVSSEHLSYPGSVLASEVTCLE